MEVEEQGPAKGWTWAESPAAAQTKDVPQEPSSKGALLASAAAASVRPAATLATEIATNPNVPKAVATAGRVIGGAAPVVGGAAELGPAGALLGMGQIAKGSWAGGRAGYFSGKLIQDMAAPVAKALDTLAPYAQAISTVSGAQGVLDLAQMADKTRQDIGTLGISLGKERSDAEKATNPTLVSAVVSKVKALSNALAQSGVPAPDAHAVKLVSAGNPSLFGRLMTLYLGGTSNGGS